MIRMNGGVRIGVLLGGVLIRLLRGRLVCWVAGNDCLMCDV